jgi:hypothetical protein
VVQCRGAPRTTKFLPNGCVTWWFGSLAHCHTARCVFHEADLRRLCHACDLNHFSLILGGSRPLSTRIRLEWRILWWFCRDLRLMWRSTWQRTTRIRLKWPISWWFVEVCSSFGMRPRRNHQDPSLMADFLVVHDDLQLVRRRTLQRTTRVLTTMA